MIPLIHGIVDSVFDPRSIEGLITWWDTAYAGNTIDGSGTPSFSEIVDRSPTGNDLTMATKTLQPIVITEDGVQWWTTNGSTQHMAAAIPTFLSSVTEYTIFWMFENTTTMNLVMDFSNPVNSDEWMSFGARADASSVGYTSLCFNIRSIASSREIFPQPPAGDISHMLQDQSSPFRLKIVTWTYGVS